MDPKHFVQLIFRTTRFFLFITLCILLTFRAVLPPPVRAATVRYAIPGGLLSGTCASWATACELRYALSAAVSSDEIWVKTGTYTPGVARTSTFQLKNGVALYGGFAGTETLRTERNWTTNVTTLSGEIGAAGNSDNVYNVVTGNGTNSTAVLDGFTVTGGNANGGTFGTSVGGGMINDVGSPSVSNMIFTGNTASPTGGGMFNYSSSAVLTNITFQSNSASSSGGGMYNWNSSPTMTFITFTLNTTLNGGGGLANDTSNPTMNNVSFVSNSADYYGGGISNYKSSPTLTNVTFSGNTATNVGGGGLYNGTTSNPTLTNVLFTGNSSSSGSGGGLYNSGSGAPTLNNVTFSGNTVSLFGGGVYNFSGTATLTNVTFASNSADFGGAIANTAGNTVIVRNGILWGNTALASPQIDNPGGAITSVTYSDVQGGFSGTGNINADPKFGTLGNYGGATQTIPLLPDSPAIDAANDVVCPASDQRGIGRPQGARCDMGAFESRGFTFTKNSGDNQGALLNTGFPNPLSVLVTSAFGEPVNGGRINFYAPVSGASASLVTSPATIAGGTASVIAIANNIPGSYNVLATAIGETASTSFTLVNLLRNVGLAPASQSRLGDPGTSITYTLALTNTGNFTDTFTIGIGGNNWTTVTPTPVGPLAAGVSANVLVTVTIPGNAPHGSSDLATITATSQGDGTKSTTSTLRSRVYFKTLLPFSSKNP